MPKTPPPVRSALRNTTDRGGIAATDEVGYDDGEGVDISKSPFDNLVAGKGSYGQFKDYLKGIGNMNNLRYYFDAQKGVSETYAKGKFQQMLQNTDNQTEIFNTIWTNTALRGSLFKDDGIDFTQPDNIIRPIGLAKFQDKVNSLLNPFYGFIKVK